MLLEREVLRACFTRQIHPRLWKVLSHFTPFHRSYSVVANESFESRRKALMEAIVKERFEKTGLRKLAYYIQTSEDADSFSSIYEQWQRKQLPFNCIADGSIIIDIMLNAGAKSALFGCLSNQYLYKLLPKKSQLDALMDQYVNTYFKAIQDQSSEEKVIECLDDVFKCFTLYVYYDVVPNEKVYEKLIVAGAYGPYQEGHRRAIITATEQDYLGIPMTLDTHCAHIVAQLRMETEKEKLVEMANVFMKTLSDKVEAPVSCFGLAMQLYLAAQDTAGAIKVLEAAVQREKEHCPSQTLFGSLYWKPIQDVVVESIEQVKQGQDHTLLLKAKVICGHSADIKGIGSKAVELF